MSIDWEDILGAEGDDIQYCYDDFCGEGSYPYHPAYVSCCNTADDSAYDWDYREELEDDSEYDESEEFIFDDVIEVNEAVTTEGSYSQEEISPLCHCCPVIQALSQSEVYDDGDILPFD